MRRGRGPVLSESSGEFRRTLPALGAAVPIVILFVAVLSVVLTAAGPRGLGLSDAQTSGWIVVVYGLPALPSLVLTVRYRQPMLLTGNVFAIISFEQQRDTRTQDAVRIEYGGVRPVEDE